MRSKVVLAACTCAAMLLAGTAAADTMHPELGAKLSGMGEHGIVNLTLKQTHHEICWTFDIPTMHPTGASVRDAHGMVVAKLGTKYSKKGCAMVPAKSISTIEAAPAKYQVWVATSGHPGDLRGKLFVGMAHM